MQELLTSTWGKMKEIANVKITPKGLEANDSLVIKGNMTEIFHALGCQYPKYFKMDGLCRVGFLCAEYLLRDMDSAVKENMSVILFNRSGSLVTDRNYQKTISDKNNYFPSPALFVYTLANIVTGEIAIRHKIYGETSFYIQESEDKTQMDRLVEDCLNYSEATNVLTGWVEYQDENNYLGEMRILER